MYLREQFNSDVMVTVSAVENGFLWESLSKRKKHQGHNRSSTEPLPKEPAADHESNDLTQSTSDAIMPYKNITHSFRTVSS